MEKLKQWTVVKCPDCGYTMRIQEGYHEDASGVFAPPECPKCRFKFNTGDNDNNEQEE